MDKKLTVNHFEAGQASAIAFVYEVLADTAERLNPVTHEIDLIYGKSASEFRMNATFWGLRSLNLRGK